MTFEDLKPLVDWLQANPGLAGFATFVISIAESLAIIGLLIPGTLVMGAIGTLIGTGVLPGIEITLWAIAGAVVGDGMSYWLGYHYHGHIRDMWPFRSYPALLRKGENFFLKYGGMSVFMGRFIGPIRPIIPVVAGMMNMPPSRFTLANVGSAIAWAPAYMMPGILLGALSVQLAPQTGTRFLLFAVVALLVLWAAFWLLKLFCRFLVHVLNLQWAFGLSLLIFCGFTIYAYQHGVMTGLNTAALDAMVSIRFDKGDLVMAAVALLGNAIVLGVLFFSVLGWLWFKQQRRAAKSWIFLGLITTIIVALLQWLIPYTHPAPFTVAISGWAFPSHSSALHTALLGYLGFLWLQKWPDARSWIYTIIGTLIAFISFAELYLSIHTFTAIISGILLGISCLLGVLFFYTRRYTIPVAPVGLLVTTILALSFSWAGMMYGFYPRVLEKYSPLSLAPTILHAKTWWSLGYPVQAKQIQWASMLKTIERELRAAGWEVVPKPDFAMIVNRIAAKNRYEQLPLFPKLYLNRKAELIMTRKVGDPERLLVLRLWDANLLLDSPALPVWVGTMDYHTPWQTPRWNNKKNQAPAPVLPSPMEVLTPALKNFTSKTIHTSGGDVLLIISGKGP